MKELLSLKPRLSEQSYMLAQKEGVYVFDVPASANKHDVAKSVREQFQVEVKAVNITNIKGKVKATISLTGRRRRNTPGERSDVKKAYVSLAKGNSLPIFEAIEESEEKEKDAQDQVDKAMARQHKQDQRKSSAAAAPKQSGRGLRIFKKQGDK